jgi:hypothetical protein
VTGYSIEREDLTMRFQLFLASAVILGLVFTNGTMAHGSGRDVGQRPFVGLWQAIDSGDGSTQTLSITCSHRNTCDVRLSDTAFKLSCPNNQIGDQIGFAHGVGSIKRNVLTVDFTLYCDPFVPDVEDIPTAEQLNYFELDRRNGTLTNSNEDPKRKGLENVFHKISK